MKFATIIPEGGIIDLGPEITQKEEVIAEMAKVFVALGLIRSDELCKVHEALLARENAQSTWLGSGVALPNAKHGSITNLVCLMARCKTGIDWEALDGEPVFVIFLWLAPPADPNVHLEALALISRLSQDERIIRFLRDVRNVTDMRELLDDADQILSE